jgi:hypothetical protein
MVAVVVVTPRGCHHPGRPLRTVSSPYADVPVDSVIVVAANPAISACCGDAMGLDNIVLLR